ncbi:MAG: hypothetical protein HQ503_00820 [Rhodospirillales bacterium]|nr:hypothetical protein [Rhodospirillales bacterium]
MGPAFWLALLPGLPLIILATMFCAVYVAKTVASLAGSVIGPRAAYERPYGLAGAVAEVFGGLATLAAAFI